MTHFETILAAFRFTHGYAEKLAADLADDEIALLLKFFFQVHADDGVIFRENDACWHASLPPWCGVLDDPANNVQE